MLTATLLGTAGIAFALAANAQTFTERSNDRIDAERDRQATVPSQQESGTAALDRAERSNTETGVSQDQLIAQRVQAALDDDPELTDVYLRVVADNGQVRINGMVATTSQRDRAIETASAVQGVAGVDDGITLRQRSASR
jgi:osmotically-inducible protein OsmY